MRWDFLKVQSFSKVSTKFQQRRTTIIELRLRILICPWHTTSTSLCKPPIRNHQMLIWPVISRLPLQDPIPKEAKLCWISLTNLMDCKFLKSSIRDTMNRCVKKAKDTSVATKKKTLWTSLTSRCRKFIRMIHLSSKMQYLAQRRNLPLLNS